MKQCPKVRKKSSLTAPSSEEIQGFFTGIAQSGSKSIVLSIVPPFNNEFLPKKTNLPDAVTALYREEYMDLDYIELLEKCHNTQMSITEAECRAIEKETRNQAESKVWFAQRAGRITASKLKAACRTDISKPSKSLIKQICYPEAHKFYSAATSWGCKHEKRAINVYANKMSDSHKKFLVSDSGLHVNPNWPHLGASPDGLVECACCGQGTCEIKCPFCSRDKTTEETAGLKNSCLLQVENKLSLDRQHAYYYQVQAQLFICEVEFCDFVLWSEQDVYIERIIPDNKFWEEVVAKATKFFYIGILPEIMGKWYTKPVIPTDVNIELTENEDEGPWCYCKENIEGSMLIGCDNDACKIMWFHMKCLKLDVAPKGKWYCPTCMKSK